MRKRSKGGSEKKGEREERKRKRRIIIELHVFFMATDLAPCPLPSVKVGTNEN